MYKVKTYTEPTTLYVVGSGDREKEKEEFCILITDDYCSGTVRDNKNTDEWIETDGGMSVLTEEQFKEDEASKLESGDYYEEYIEYVKFENFVGDIYIQLLDDTGKDYLIDNPDINDYIQYQYKEGKEGWCEPVLLFVGNYDQSSTGKYAEVEY